MGYLNVTSYKGQDFNSKAEENRDIKITFGEKVNRLTLILVEIKYLMSPKHKHLTKSFIIAMQKEIRNNQTKDQIFLCLIKS